MNLLRQTEFVILDVETTGLSPRQGDRIIEIAALKIRDLKPIDRFYSLVDPQCAISAGASFVNQITSEMLAGAPLSQEVMPEFLKFLGGACLVGHNIQFDISFVANELELIGRSLPEDMKVLDTVKMARALLPQIGRYNLVNVAQSLAIEVTEVHRAMADVELTWQVFRYLLEAADRRDMGEMDALLKLFSRRMVAEVSAIEEHVSLINQAIVLAQTLHMVYAGKKSTELSTRKVTPRKLLGTGEKKTLVGFCHVAKAERHFKLERIVRLESEGKG